MLERKQLLKVKTQHSRDGRLLFVYEQPKTGDIFQIPDPNLQLDQLEQVQHEVLHLLQHGLEGQGDSDPGGASTSTENASEQVLSEKPETVA